jgi:molecular chaperone IbpA
MKSFVGFDNLFDEFDRTINFKDQSYPAYNIEKVSETDYKISLALAGFTEKEISAEMKDGILTVTASSSDDQKSSSYIHRGIAKRSFSRQFRLAENIEVIDAELVNGLLTISLCKNIPEAELPKQIKIKSSLKSLPKKAA